MHNSVPRHQSKSTSPDHHSIQLAAMLQDSRVALVSERVRNQAILNSLGEGLVIIDAEGKITTANPYLLNMLGFAESDLRSSLQNIARRYRERIAGIHRTIVPPTFCYGSKPVLAFGHSG